MDGVVYGNIEQLFFASQDREVARLFR